MIDGGKGDGHGIELRSVRCGWVALKSAIEDCHGIGSSGCG